MRYLIFPLYAPLASWGDTAVGEFRPSFSYPSRSAVLGLLGAALGLDRSDDEAHQALSQDYAVAVAVYEEGSLLRDYHTAQAPKAASLKKRPHRTRADELSVSRDELSTILSTRDYRQDGVSLICLWCRNDAARWALDALKEAMEKPRFVLYLGRKSCPPALPLKPDIVEAVDVKSAFNLVTSRIEDLRIQLNRDASLKLRRIAWEEGISSGYEPTFTVTRKDEPRSRRRWQFSDRVEHVYVAYPEGAADTEDA